jgi:hypothetical protein
MTKQTLRLLILLFGLLLPLLLGVHASKAPVHRALDRVEALATALAKPDAAPQARLSAAYGRLPLSFEANQGQTDSRVQFLSRGKDYSLFLISTEVVLALRNGTRGLQNAEQVTASLDSLPLTPFSTLHLPQSTRHIAHSAFRTPHPAVLRMKLVGANSTSQAEALEPLPGKVNYFLGNDPKRWRTAILTYAKVKYRNVYPGIDLVYYGKQQQLEYDFVVAPGADPKTIRLSFEGVDKLEVDRQGNLVLHTAAGNLVQHAPSIYQEIEGTKQRISGRYTLLETQSTALSIEDAPASMRQVGFVVATYNSSRTLVIDPVLVYSTYLGGSTFDRGEAITVDSAGNAYVTGFTASPDFPTQNPLQPALNGFRDAFVAKLNAAGSALLYSTYLGGSGFDGGSGVAVDSAGNAYVTGDTSSADFPTQNPLQPANESGAEDTFVAKLNTAGSALLYSTYLGGSIDDFGSGIAVDSAGNAYVTGSTSSRDFPTQNPLQPTIGGFPCEFGCSSDAFVAKLNAAGSALLYSTYLGGRGDETGSFIFLVGPAIAVDTAGNAYVTGSTSSRDFPTVSPLQPVFGGGSFDAFVAKLNTAGSALVYSTYLGGSVDESSAGLGGDFGGSIAVDSAGSAYVVGLTESPDFPTQNPLQPVIGGLPCGLFGCRDAFVAKLNAAGSALLYSTYLGGSEEDSGFGIAVDTAGNAYVTGQTSSPNFPTQNPLQPTIGGDLDAFLAKLNAAGSALVYSTYLGGSGDDHALGISVHSTGNAYISGLTFSTDFPTKNPIQPTHAGAFVAKIASGALPATIDIKPGSSPNSINPRSNGNISVAVLTTNSFDAGSVDVNTVRFGRTGQEAAPLRSSLEDVDGDGDSDLVLHFDTQQTGILCGDSSARLTGRTFDGEPIEGSDSISTVGCQ